MQSKAFIIAILLVFEVLLILQAGFAKQIGAWKAGRVRHYPRVLKGFYLLFSPQSTLAADFAFMAAVFGGIIIVAIVLTILFQKPVSH